MALPDNCFVFDGMVPSELCRQAIRLFELNEVRMSSRAYADARGSLDAASFPPVAESEGRAGTVVPCSGNYELRELADELKHHFSKAVSKAAALSPGLGSLIEEEPSLTTPRLECICPGQGFDWHMDSRHQSGDQRFLTLLLYLNDVPFGGETEFFSTGAKIQPTEGRMLLLPPYWTHLHRGNSPIGGNKYTASCGLARINADSSGRHLY